MNCLIYITTELGDDIEYKYKDTTTASENTFAGARSL
jgi:hypothetical protein